MDPIWYSSKQEISFLNGFKMKMSVIYGVGQMLLGVVLKGLNAISHGDYVELIFVVFTQIVLLSVLFGFMDAMIIQKWLTDWFSPEFESKCQSPPSIISFMIQMFIYGGVKPGGAIMNGDECVKWEDGDIISN